MDDKPTMLTLHGKDIIKVNLSDPETMRDIAEAIEEINKGHYGTPLNEIEKELGL